MLGGFRHWILFAIVGIVPTAHAQGTIFSILLKPAEDESQPSPQEYFEELQQFFSEQAQSGAAGGAAGAGTSAGGTSAGGTGASAGSTSAGGTSAGGTGASAGGTSASGAGSGAGFGPNSGFTFLSAVDPTQDFSDGVIILQECDLDPFWEKGKIVTDLKYCPLSTTKVVVYALVPTVIMFFGLIGIWSRQRNVGGRGKETDISSLVALSIVLLSASYDWFFSWELFRNPRPGFQLKVSEFGLAHLIGCAALNFLMVHFWFRRKFLVGMPWYEYHKHGFGMHVVFSLMYVQPQSVILFKARLFNSDLFNIHFGTPSKMNEVLSQLGCLSLLEDVPQFLLQLSVWMADEHGRDAPKVSRVSMALTCISIAVSMKRQYIATVERNWYKEIVKMAGVKRLSVYGGASRWLKFQKRPGADKDVKSSSTSQQQLFLAWMQSMGRRKESIFDNDDERKGLTDGDSFSEDSSDEIDDLSHDSDSEEGSGEDEGSEESGDEGEESEDEGEESESGLSSEGQEEEEEEDGSVTLQSYGRRRGKSKRRPADEEAPFGSRRRAEGSSLPSDSESGILGFARGIADDVSGTSAGIASESDIFAFARKVAGKASESGVLTESSADLNAPSRGRGRAKRNARERAFDSADYFSESGSIDDNGILGFARGVADDVSQVGTSDTGASDIFGFARKVAKATHGGSESGVGGSSAGSDIWKFARQAADQVSGITGVSDGQSDIFAFARNVANRAADGESSITAGGSDIFAFARNQADLVSGVGSASGVGSTVGGSDIFAYAQRAAEQMSQSGVNLGKIAQATSKQKPRPKKPARDDVSSVGGSEMSDIFAIARMAADNVSESNAGTGSKISDIFAINGAVEPGSRPRPRAPSTSGQSDADSDIFNVARMAAGEISESGVGSSVGSDIFAAARRAAGEVSESGIDSKSGIRTPAGMSGVFANAKASASRSSQRPKSEISDAESDIFAAARNAALDISQSGVGSRSGIQSTVAGMSDIFGNAKGSPAPPSGSRAQQPVEQVFEDAESEGGDSESDIFEVVRKTADGISHSGVQSASAVRSAVRGGMDNIFAMVGAPPPAPPPKKGAKALPVPPKSLPPAPGALPMQRQMSEVSSNAGSELDLLAIAQGVADQTSRSGVGTSVAAASRISQGMSDLFGGNPRRALPKGQRAAPQPSTPLAPKQNQRPKAPPKASTPSVAQTPLPPQDIPDEYSGISGADSDILGAARRAAQGEADVFSQSGVSGVESDILGTARRAAQGEVDVFSQSGVSGVESDILGTARRAAGEMSESGGDSQSDIFAAAREAADGCSQSGVGTSRAGTRSGIGGMNDIFAFAQRAGQNASEAGSASQSGAGSDFDIFAVAQRAAQQAPTMPSRQFAPEGRHRAAAPLMLERSGLVPAEIDPDQPPWAVHQFPGRRPPLPPKSQRRPPSPPGTPPQFDTLPLPHTMESHELPPLPTLSATPSIPTSDVQNAASLFAGVPVARPKARKKQKPQDANYSQQPSQFSDGQMLQFAREVAAAAQPPVAASGIEAQWDSNGSGLEGLFLRRQSPAQQDRVKDVEKPPALAPPKLLAKLRLPLDMGLQSSGQPPSESSERRPSPRSLRIACEQRRQQDRHRRNFPTTAEHSGGREANVIEKVQPEAKVTEGIYADRHRQAEGTTSQPLHFMMTESLRPDAMPDEIGDENNGSQFEHYLLTDRSLQDEEPSSSSVPLVTPRVATQPIHYMLTPSLQDYDVEPPRSSGSTVTVGRTPIQHLLTPMVSPRPLDGEVHSGTLADENLATTGSIAQHTTPMRQESLASEGSFTEDSKRRPSVSIEGSPECSPKSAKQEARSPPLSPTSPVESRQQRVLLRQARLRDGVEDRDYKRKKSRAAHRELEESQQG